MWRPFLPDADDDMVLELALDEFHARIASTNGFRFVGAEAVHNDDAGSPGQAGQRALDVWRFVVGEDEGGDLQSKIGVGS